VHDSKFRHPGRAAQFFCSEVDVARLLLKTSVTKRRPTHVADKSQFGSIRVMMPLYATEFTFFKQAHRGTSADIGFAMAKLPHSIGVELICEL
jgi:hypothetical protein